MKYNEFKTKEEYLAYRSEWKAEYKQLSQDIRDLKFCRNFPMANRFDNPENVKRYREIEKRLFPSANQHVYWELESKRAQATGMLEQLKEAKMMANYQYLEQKVAA